MLKRWLALGIAIVLVATLIPALNVQAQGYCEGALFPRLQVGGQGRVTPGLPNILRNQPYRGYDSVVIGEIPAGGLFSVVGGPSCYDGMYWWQVVYNGQIGWTPEGSRYGVYWTEPTVVATDCMTAPSRLAIGQTGQVTAGLPNVIRALPRQGSDSAIIATMPGGSTFTVLNGPSCFNQMTWWQVNYNGVIGWTPEGQGSTYWLQPFGIVPPTQCLNTGSRLMAGFTGRVLSGLPNRLRAQPTIYSAELATINANDTFVVLTGPTCADGVSWWQVNYRGLTGWTAEGDNGQYYVEPVTCPGFQPSRLSSGRHGRVTPGLPNRLRAYASTSAAAISLIPAGAQFDVIGGPVCGENAAWWQVNYRGQIGWTMEGQGYQYWLELSG